MDVDGAQYVSVKSVNCETTVDDFKSRWLAQEKPDATPGLVSLRLVKRGLGGVPTAEQEAEALQSPTSLLADPSQTLAKAGVAGGSWLVAVFASAVAAASKALDALDISVDDSPSSFSDSKVCAKYQKRSDGPTFECFRPFVGPPLALPASLVSPIFARFLDDCNADLASLGRCDLESNCAMALLAVMPDFFKTEAERQTRVNHALSTLFSQPLQLLQSNVAESASRSDGGLLASVDGIDALVLLTEHKNEMGSSGDPYFQLLRMYGLFWQAPGRCNSNVFRCDACPALAIEVVGPLLRVNALASLHSNRVLCEPLTAFIPVLLLRDQPLAMARLVATLRALRTAVRRLNAHYKGFTPPEAGRVRTAPGSSRDPGIALPYPLRDAARFTDVVHLCDDKLLYAARDETRDETRADAQVCVKFSRRGYGREVHAAWAGAGHAPAVYEVCALPGGLTMAVMELLPRTHGWCMLSEGMPQEAWAAARAALQVVHATELPGGGGRGVHGDCRPNNVLLRQGPSSDSYDVRFVDFDGAGVDGLRTYPPFMNPSVEWPFGAVAGEALRQEHDVALLAAGGGRSL
jgi:hypothetical protein